MSSTLPATAGPRTGARTLAFLAALALALVAARALARGIHVPGHNALPALFFAVLAVAVARLPGAAIAVALPAAALAWAGTSAGGAATLLLSAAIVDAAALLAPRFPERWLACALVGAAAGAARLVPDLALLAAGLPDHGAPALLSALGHASFGAAGAVAVPLLRRARRGAERRVP